MGIDLSVGGWDGWYFSQYGRAKQWRLIAPGGENYLPGEIMELRALQLNVDYLSLRVKQLKAIARPALSPDDFRSLSLAVATLEDFLGVFASLGGYPMNNGRRTPITLDSLANSVVITDD